MMRRFFLVLAILVAAPAAQGQTGLPTLPEVGALPAPVLDRATQTTNGTLGEATNLIDARRNQIRSLLRQHRRELEADPQGQPIVRNQIIAVDMSTQARERAREQGFTIVSRDDMGEAGALVVLRAPRHMPTRRALRRLREADPAGIYDFDHLHLESGLASALPAAQQSAPGAGPRVGVIDGGVAGGAVAQRAFAGVAPRADPHAEAVTALLARSAPRVRLYVADIYAGAPTGGASSALARALAWLADENVPVINVSLVGPRNRVVETMIARLAQRGIVVVAAVGNDGPAAGPLYPAAYDGVIGVTGVDTQARVLMEAGRGPQVDFAALGIHDQPRVRGTSFAAPIVAGLIATRASSPSTALARLRSEARDLGPPGRDTVYGDGLVGGSLLAQAR